MAPSPTCHRLRPALTPSITTEARPASDQAATTTAQSNRRSLWPRSLGLGPSHYYKNLFIIVRRAKAK